MHKAIGIIALVLFVHAFAVVFDWYGTFWWIDMVMHWSGGFAMAFLGFALWSYFVYSYEVEGKGRFARFATLIVKFGWVIAFVALVSIAWEWFEFLCDLWFPSFVPAYKAAQPGLGDTMADFFFDLFGGVVGFLLARRYDR
ncbi:MAG: hypothetical protein UY72_C0070G0003 [Candidatus Uhrbacteria bacterium GW2011_GWD2_52_7]|uniref:Uncharacterized protein n=1 Tax=Candidatus Uhrbacteria bacterium GW2011_GWD2_52_7 TaxID=1618989 RepID=A0A0G1ZKB9_9BACT|nr:MAG: hypothetical protein UY72_C0070G0003 [Candidatus Uhrbacteria bacterium GW2011_GWD2_52_7]